MSDQLELSNFQRGNYQANFISRCFLKIGYFLFENSSECKRNTLEHNPQIFMISILQICCSACTSVNERIYSSGPTR